MPAYSHGLLYSYTHAHKHVFAYAHELMHITLLHYTHTLTFICSTHSPHATATTNTHGLTCTSSCTHMPMFTHTYAHTSNTLRTPWAHSVDISCLWEGQAEFKVPCTKPWASQVLNYDLLFLVSLERFYTTMKTQSWRIDVIRRRVEFYSSFKPTGCIPLCFL